MKEALEPIARDGMTLTQIYNRRLAAEPEDKGIRWVWANGDLKLQPIPGFVHRR